jgi:hypothetical protein
VSWGASNKKKEEARKKKGKKLVPRFGAYPERCAEALRAGQLCGSTARRDPGRGKEGRSEIRRANNSYPGWYDAR